MAATEYVTDYLVVGAGLSGLAFVDELLTHTTEPSIIIVDKQSQAGGHWIDSYSYVKLHQPAATYGVNSTELSNGLKDVTGFNKGLGDLASGPEVQAYFSRLMRERFLRSGRVTFLPCTEWTPEGTLKNTLNGELVKVQVNKKLVDGTYYTNDIPLNHTRPFQVDGAVACVPPNYLPRYASNFSHYTILGGGKTGIDAVIWLLTHGVAKEQIRWIIPGEYWYLNRATAQPHAFEMAADMLEDFASATDPVDMAHKLEASGFFMRLDPNIEPHQFHFASLTFAEVEVLRTMQDIVRKGHVKLIQPEQVTLTGGTIDAKPGSLYIDCTASAIGYHPIVPVFQPGKITIQLVRSPSVGFSAAKIGFLESLDMTDEERNKFSAPLRFTKTIEEFISVMHRDLLNRANEAGHPELLKWLQAARIEGFTQQASKLNPETDGELFKQLGRMGAAMGPAIENMGKLAAATGFTQS